MKNIKAKLSVLVKFSDDDEFGLRSKHDKILETYCNGISHAVKTIECRSDDAEEIIKKILVCINENINPSDLPLRILCDINTAPPLITIAIIKALIDRGLASKFTFFYSEVEYSGKEDQTERWVFTEGAWAPVRIPGMGSLQNPGMDSQLIVGIGFEGTKAFRAVKEENPSKVATVFPSPGFTPKYEEIAKEKNLSLYEAYNIDEKTEVKANAADAIDVWKKMDEKNMEMHKDYNVFYISFGTKAQALGIALRAITSGYDYSYLYAVPDKYKVKSYTDLNRYWFYEITDLSVIQGR